MTLVLSKDELEKMSPCSPPPQIWQVSKSWAGMAKEERKTIYRKDNILFNLTHMLVVWRSFSRTLHKVVQLLLLPCSLDWGFIWPSPNRWRLDYPCLMNRSRSRAASNIVWRYTSRKIGAGCNFFALHFCDSAHLAPSLCKLHPWTMRSPLVCLL